MSTSAHAPPLQRGAVHRRRAASRYRGRPLTISNPATGELVGTRHPRRRRGPSTRRCRPPRRRSATGPALGYADRGEVLHACAEAFDAHVEELVPILVAEQGKTIREARIELHKAAETLEHYAGMRQARSAASTSTGSIRASTAACCAGRSASWPRSCRGTSRRRCCATSSARRCCAATRSSPSRPTRPRSPRCGWPRSSPRPGCPPGVLNVVTGDRPRGRRGARHAIRWCARSRSPARRRPASASARWPPPAPSG